MNNKNTIVYVKVNGKRPKEFQNPVPFEWNRDKEKQLWSIVSKLDNYQDQIDWKDLSKSLEAPEYFLKRRSYKLSAKQLKLLEQQIERKMKVVHNSAESQETSVRQFATGLTNPLTTNISRSSSNGIENPLNVKIEDTNSKALHQLHSSRLLGNRKLPAENERERKFVTRGENGSDSEISSSLSISNSALEEALMDRLQL